MYILNIHESALLKYIYECTLSDFFNLALGYQSLKVLKDYITKFKMFTVFQNQNINFKSKIIEFQQVYKEVSKMK